MLIYSKERLVPTDVNMMVLRSKNNEGFFYIHRALYDQAVVINDIYGEDPSNLILALTNKEESRADVDYFLENAPYPIHILGPFLLLVKEELTDFVDMIGAIHVMSGPLSLRGMLKIPYELRNMNPSFSLSIKEEYQLAWDRFFQNAMPYTDDMFHMHEATPMNGVQTTTVEKSVPTYEEPEQEETGYEDIGIDAETMAFLMGDDDPFAELDEEETVAEDVAEAIAETPVIEQKVEQVPVQEPEAVKVLSGVDAILNL